MAWLVRHIIASPFTNNDLSSYVVSTNDFPVYKGNDDLSPVAHSFSFDISQTYTTAINVGDIIQVSGPTTSQRFDVKKVKTEKTNRTINIYCEHPLAKLRNYFLTEDALDTLITTTVDQNKYCSGDNRSGVYTYENAQLLWIIEQMFYVAGISNYLLTDETDTAINLDSTDFAFEDIVLDYKMLYTINQSTTDTRETTVFITFWDFIQFCCAFWGFTFYEYNGTILMLSKQTLTEVESNIGYSEDYLLAYEETESENKQILALCDIYWAGSIDAYYSGSDVACTTNLNTNTTDEPSFNWFSNLRFLLRDTAGSDGDVYENGGGTVYVDFFTNYSGVTNKMIEQSIENDYVEKSYELMATNDLLADKYLANEVKIDIPNQILKITYKDFS